LQACYSRRRPARTASLPVAPGAAARTESRADWLHDRYRYRFHADNAVVYTIRFRRSTSVIHPAARRRRVSPGGDNRAGEPEMTRR
jgi:hypothetical protein